MSAFAFSASSFSFCFAAFSAWRSAFVFFPPAVDCTTPVPLASGGLLTMYVASLCIWSAEQWWPHALQSNMISFFFVTSIDVSGSLHFGQSTHCSMNLNTFFCRSAVSWWPLMQPEPCSASYVEITPSSTEQYLVMYSPGRFSDLPRSDALTSTVFFPLPRPSCLPTIGGILYR